MVINYLSYRITRKLCENIYTINGMINYSFLIDDIL